MTQYEKYKNEFFKKLGIKFKKGASILDLGCGDGGDAKIFIKKFGLRTYACDIFKHKNLETISKLTFKMGGIYDIPFKDNSFDYIFLHDVMHHIDEKKQRNTWHKKGLLELSRVCRGGGEIIIVEANRYNPLFYPHMVLLNKHNHFTQKYFKKLVRSVFPSVVFNNFECHVYPVSYSMFWKLYEEIMERIMPKEFLAYNVAISKNIKK